MSEGRDKLYPDLVSLQTAKLAQEKGFDANVPDYFFDAGSRFSAPSKDILYKWLRDKLIFVHVTIEFIGSDEWVFAYEIQWLPKEDFNAKRRSQKFKVKKSFEESPGGTYWGGWDTYEEALDGGLREALKLIEI